jgi:hypothetical protein
LDVSGNRDVENQAIINYKKHGGLNQQFDVIYADRYPRDPKKGELNKDFGLYVDRTFYIASQMRSGRYIQVVGGRNIAIKTRNGRKSQQWWFDQKTLTIKTRSNNQSIEIENSGKKANLRVWSTHSQWW